MENNSNIKFCPECGSSNAVSDDFCSECGYNFKARADDTVISTPTNKRHSGIIISIIICIVIVVIGAGVYYYLDTDSKETEVAEAMPTSEVQSTPIIQVTTEPTPNTVTDEVLNKIPDYADGDIRAQYIFPDADKEMINERAFQYLSTPELELARNEIYARHGRQFQTEYIQQYFNSRPWYKINPNYNYDNEDSMLSQIELENVKIIVAEENRRKEN